VHLACPFVAWLCHQKPCAPLARGGFCFLAAQQKFYAIRTTYFLAIPNYARWEENLNLCQAKKILACITPQSNSKRLIDKAFEISQKNNGELHILHVETGGNLFFSENSTALLQSLFNYGARMGGSVHGVAAADAAKAIIKFIREEKITDVVLGAPIGSPPVKSSDIYAKLIMAIPRLDITVLGQP
jgi:K+-sensing histidine kinase KdpD